MSPSRRQPDAEATMAAILEAATMLFLDKGFAGTSVSQVAKAANVTKSLIHHHFGTKENLWMAVKMEIFGEYGRAQRQILEQEGAPEEVIKSSFEAYFRFLQTHPEVVRMLAIDVVEKGGLRGHDAEDQDCMGDVADLFGLGLERIKQAQEAGLARDDIAPASVLAAFFSLAEHWFMSRPHLLAHLGEDAGEDLDDRYLRDATDLLVRSIKPQ